MSSSTKFGLSTQTTLVTTMANAGSTKKAITEAFEAKGFTPKKTKVTIDYIVESESITFRGKGAQNWREQMTEHLRDDPDMTSTTFKQIFDEEFPQITEKRRVEYTRYYFNMMSSLRKMPYTK